VLHFNEITPSKLLGNKIKFKEKFSVVLVHSDCKNAQLLCLYFGNLIIACVIEVLPRCKYSRFKLLESIHNTHV
jgi:serine/threonine protein kinase